MLTESCVMFFSPSRAALSAILRDEYLTSAVRSKKFSPFPLPTPVDQKPVHRLLFNRLKPLFKLDQENLGITV